MGTITRFEEIEAWQSSRELTRLVYELTKTGDFARDFGLRDQIRRASVSILSNIAEGFESRTQSLFVEFLGRAKASAGELRAQAYVALDAGYIGSTDFEKLIGLASQCSRQISRFVSYLETVPNNRRVREVETEYSLETL